MILSGTGEPFGGKLQVEPPTKGNAYISIANWLASLHKNPKTKTEYANKASQKHPPGHPRAARH